jgi:hypothetical protein
MVTLNHATLKRGSRPWLPRGPPDKGSGLWCINDQKSARGTACGARAWVFAAKAADSVNLRKSDRAFRLHWKSVHIALERQPSEIGDKRRSRREVGR